MFYVTIIFSTFIWRLLLFVWRKHENMYPCTGSRDLPVMSELLHVLEPSFDRGPQSLKATPPPAIMPSALTTQPWPVRQKRTGTSRMVSHSRHNNEPTLSRKDSALGCLQLALLLSMTRAIYNTGRIIPKCAPFQESIQEKPLSMVLFD